MSNHWQKIQQTWNQLGPPLRPNVEVVDSLRRLLGNATDRILMLGVTPEFVDLGRDVLAVDINPVMIANVWPGDTAHRRAIEGDWLNLPCDAESRQAVICDGGLTAIGYADDYDALFVQVSKVLEPGGRALFRTFMTPSPCETVEEVVAALWRDEIGSIHALKWRLAMALVSANADPSIAVGRILETFVERFPDRVELAHATGWSAEAIATIDNYRGSTAVYSFPTNDELLTVAGNHFSDASLTSSGTYEMAERCPILVMNKD